MNEINNLFKKVNRNFIEDSLYSNSIYLMLGTAVMAFFGFFFWVINTRLFKPEQVGIATTLISVVTLISSFGMLGLGSGLIKYLPTSERKNRKINTSFTLVILTTASISIIYLIFLGTFSPNLLIIKENFIFSLLFILFVVFSSLNLISENIFIAYRASKYVLIKNTVSSVVKLILPVLLISLGAYGILMSAGISVIIAFVLGLIFLIFKFNYLIKPTVNKDILKRMTKFSLGNYIAGFITGLPAMVLPVIIINSIGAKFSAYFYMDMMIINLLYIIPSAASQSLFAEGSHNEAELKKHAIKAGKVIAVIMIPAIIATVVFGKYILLAFGKSYSDGGFIFLQLLALSVVFNSISTVFGSILRVKNKVKELIVISVIGSFITLTLSLSFVRYGLEGIGVIWLVSQLITSLISITIYKKISSESIL